VLPKGVKLKIYDLNIIYTCLVHNLFLQFSQKVLFLKSVSCNELLKCITHLLYFSESNRKHVLVHELLLLQFYHKTMIRQTQDYKIPVLI
jgi:hypothetical protein